MSEYLDKHVKRLLSECPDLDSTTVLSLKDLPFIRIATINVGVHWYNLGIYFGLSTNFLDELRTKFRQKSDRCLSAVLAEWLKNSSSRTGPPTWRGVVIAVASKVGGDNPSEARKIAKDYRKYGHKPEFKGLDEVNGNPLKPADLISVKAALMEGVADKWLSVGLMLGVPYHRLEACEMEDTLNQRMTMMITEWLSRRYDTHIFGEPSWRRLVEVIASRAGGCHKYLATQLAKQYPVQAMQPMDYSAGGASSRYGGAAVPSQPPGVLSDADLAILMEVLRPVAPKWNLLGLQLGAPLSYMQEALFIWLQQKPPDKPWPTISHLCKVLKTDVIDEDVLAAEVEKALVGRTQS